MALTKVKTGQIGTDVIVAEDIAANAITVSELQDNAVTAAKLSVSGNGTSGQALTSDGDGTFSWTTITSDLVDDASPQLGAALDTNGNNITFGDSSSSSVNRLQFGVANDLSIYHTGTSSNIADTGTGNLNIIGDDVVIYNAAANETKASFASNGSVNLYFDNSLKLQTTGTGVTVTGQMVASSVNLADSAKALFGNGGDLQIYHNGSNSYIDDTGTGNLFIRGDGDLYIQNQAGTESKARLNSNGAVTLYYNGADVFATTVDGVDINGTGSIKIPVGTTAQRPSSPTTGDLRWNTSDSTAEIYDGSDWAPIDTSGPYNVDFLVLAGGGGGGSHAGSAGGAGGLRTSYGSASGGGSSAEASLTFTPTQTYTITVGAGGGASPNSTGSNGSNSSISGYGITTVTSLGGGRGRGGTTQGAGFSGGCGGGGAAASGTAAGGAGTSGQGYAGGQSVNNWATGGGGGTGAVGGSGSGSNAGSGGSGLAVSITGSSVTRGGGGGGSAQTGSPGSGGSGGGGAGSGGAGQSGTANLGGGGGGTHDSVNRAGLGGSGVVILRIPTVNYTGTYTGSPSISTSGTDTIMQFNSSGSYTA